MPRYIARMFGPKLRSVFKSRWHALLWAGSVLLTAWCSVPSPNEPSDGDEVAALVKAARGQQAPAAHHVNPWAK